MINQGNMKEALTGSGDIAAQSARMPAGGPGLIFFRPDSAFIKWIAEYADGRLIIDVGAGTGWLVERLQDAGAMVMGIEPFFSWEERIGSAQGKELIHILPMQVEDCGMYLEEMHKRGVLMLFARPCHSEFVANALRMRPAGMEALYITIPANMYRYNDLREFEDSAVLVEHTGSSVDKEIVFSIK